MRYSRFAATLAAATLTLAACGGGSDSSGTTATTASSTSGSGADTMADTTTAGSMTDDSTADSMTDGSGDPQAEGTIVDVAAANPDFSTLVTAIQAAGLTATLTDDGPFTVFAPTNAAFEQALTNLNMTPDQLFADTALLKQILTYHVVAGDVPAATVVTMNGQEVPTVNGATLTVTVDGDNVMVNDANVTAVDIAASNGVIHQIDKVLIPPTDSGAAMDDGESMDDGSSTGSTVAGSADGSAAGSGDASTGSAGATTDNLMEVAAAVPDFSILVQAAGKAGLFQTLANDGPFTIFAPTNAAFEQALSDLGMTADQLFANQELLKKVLTYHVVAGEYPAADVATLAGGEVATLEGSPLTITVNGDSVMVNDANVTQVDVMASNGVIHVIDKVLLPPNT